MRDTRPELATITDPDVFTDWYWLKAELVEHCRTVGLSTQGDKAELTDRIAHFIETGEHRRPARRPRATSTFDWASAVITRSTIITDSYRNGPNVRRFFEAEIGPRFSFSIEFMAWMKTNVGHTMGDAVDEWLAIEARRRAGERAAIPAGNQFNRYVRDFFDANPDRSMADARACWAAKRGRAGHNRYEPADLDVLDVSAERDDDAHA
ncbi:MAG: DUF6434 domain-containing protein [Actinomycetota bacterium]